MGILDKLKNAFSASPDTDSIRDEEEIKKIITETRNEYAKDNKYFWDVKISNIEVYKNNVANWTDKKKINFILFLVNEIHNFSKGKRSWSSDDIEQQKNSVKIGYVQHLLKAKLALEDIDVKRLYETFSQNKKSDWANLNAWPIASMLNQINNQYKESELSPLLKETLLKIKAEIMAINNYDNKERLKLIEKIDNIIFKSENDETQIKPTKFLGTDEFSNYANHVITELNDADRFFWYKLIALAQKASGSKPSKNYLDETRQIFKKLGTDKFKKVVNNWFAFIISLKEKEEQHSQTYNGHVYNYSTYEFISSVNIEAIKGFVWMCSHFHDNTSIHTISNLAERTFRKIPGKGPAAAAIGNACLYVLYKSKGLDGIGELSRLKLRIKQNNTQNIIEKYLLEAAKEQGVSIHEIEDLAADDYDFIDGKKVFLFDDYKAELCITGVGKSEIKWFKADGTQQKSIPSFVKEKHAQKLKKLRDNAKQIDQTTSAQRDRIDRMFRSDRKWNWNKFESYYLKHGLMSFLTKKIIWNFEKDDKSVNAIYISNNWINNNNEIVKLQDDVSVSLWHPAKSSIAEIKLWREFLVFHKIQQPLKQAFREVYLLTDAEINTKSYSNRMAAHILKQHQFNSLAKTRGWKYALMGAYDDGRYNEAAEVKLPEFGLKAQYWVNEVNTDGAFNDTGIWNFIATDQIRFLKINTDEIVDLIEIPIVPFSEVLRDIDLFVGVASVGNDPTWQDTGGIPAYRDYWQSYSFGDLSEVAKMRRDILSSLVPRLKISKIAEIKGNFLVVKGKLRTYKIHIGSTNVLMEPNDQYLCIVPDRSQKNHTENIFLPFEGDTGLSVVLSKAFLLAEDNKITDSTITSQINRK
jgi:hypothetical protein